MANDFFFEYLILTETVIGITRCYFTLGFVLSIPLFFLSEVSPAVVAASATFCHDLSQLKILTRRLFCIREKDYVLFLFEVSTSPKIFGVAFKTRNTSETA